MAEKIEEMPFDAVAVARALGPQLAGRAAAHDAVDSFVADSYADHTSGRPFVRLPADRSAPAPRPFQRGL